MTDTVSPDIYGDTIFCDDIRHEMGNKMSFIGVYQGDIVFTTPLPVLVPKFGIVVTFMQKKEIAESELSLKIFLPGDPDDKPSIEADLPPGEPAVTGPDSTFILMRTALTLSPIQFQQEGALRVRVLRKGVLHRAGAIHVRGSAPAPISPTDAERPS